MTGRAMVAQRQPRPSNKVDAARTLSLSVRQEADPTAGDVTEHVVVSGDLKDLIVDLHNELRADVMPPAIDMQKMVRYHVVSEIE